MVSSVRFTADSQPQYTKTPRRSPPVSAVPPAPKGSSQPAAGRTAPREAVPAYTRYRATAANTNRQRVCSRTRTFCSRAAACVSRTHRAAITTITSTVSACRTRVSSARASRPTASSPKFTATSASEPTTRTPVIVIAQPPSQPAVGPSARVTHEKVVPQSGSARFR